MIKVILWDIDGTILDFERAEREAIKSCFSFFNLTECSDETILRYSAINKKYWELLERGILTKKEVVTGRFAEFFQAEGICFSDISGFNEKYAFFLSRNVFFLDNSYPLIRQLRESVKQYAVTNGNLSVQKFKLKKSGLERLFDDVFISDEVGAVKPEPAFFDYVRSRIGNYADSEIMIVGDSLTSDMRGGNNAGILCCWYNPKHFSRPDGLRIDFEIQNLNQLPDLLHHCESPKSDS